MISVLRRFKEQIEGGRGIVLSSFTSLLVRACGLIVNITAMPLALHHLGAARFGAFLLLFGIINWISLGSFGVPASLGKLIASGAIAPARIRDVLGGAVVSALVGALALGVCVAVTFVVWLHWQPDARLGVPKDEIALAATVMMALIGGQVVLHPFEGVQIGQLKSYVANLCRMIGSAFTFLALLTLPTVWPSITAFVVAVTGGPLIASVLIALVVGRSTPPRFGKALQVLRDTPGLLRSGLSFTLIGLVALGQGQLIVAILGSLEGPSQIVGFALYIRIFTILMSLVGMFTAPLWPAIISARATGDHVWAESAGQRAFVAVLVSGVAACVAIWLFGDEILSLWTRSTITSPAWVKILMGVYCLQMCWSHFWTVILMARQREMFAALVLVAEVVSFATLGSLAAVHYGQVGMLVVMTISVALCSGWLLPLVGLREDAGMLDFRRLKTRAAAPASETLADGR